MCSRERLFAEVYVGIPALGPGLGLGWGLHQQRSGSSPPAPRQDFVFGIYDSQRIGTDSSSDNPRKSAEYVVS